MIPDEVDRGRPPLLHLVLFLDIGGRRQADASVVEPGALEEPAAGVGGYAVRLRGEAAVDMTGADSQLEHHRRVGRLGELEALLDRAHHGGQAGTRVEQPDLRLHGEGVASFLDDARAVAVVFADHDERAADHAGRREVRERVGGDVRSHRRLPHRTAAHRVVDRRGEHGAGRRLVGAGLDVHPERAEDLAGVVEHVHHVGDRRALIAADVGDPRLKQCLGDGEDTFAMEHVALAEPERPNLSCKASFRHRCTTPWFPFVGRVCRHYRYIGLSKHDDPNHATRRTFCPK